MILMGNLFVNYRIDKLAIDNETINCKKSIYLQLHKVNLGRNIISEVYVGLLFGLY